MLNNYMSVASLNFTHGYYGSRVLTSHFFRACILDLVTYFEDLFTLPRVHILRAHFLAIFSVFCKNNTGHRKIYFVSVARNEKYPIGLRKRNEFLLISFRRRYSGFGISGICPKKTVSLVSPLNKSQMTCMYI